MTKMTMVTDDDDDDKDDDDDDLGVEPTVQLATSCWRTGGSTLEPRSPICKYLHIFVKVYLYC